MVKRILAVDDNEDILETIDLILSMEGYEMKTTPSPEKIENYLINFKPDLILLDIQMGRHNGLDICKAIKSSSYTSPPHVVIISSHEDIFKAKTEYLADDFILKPFNIDTLINKVDGFLRDGNFALHKAS